MAIATSTALILAGSAVVGAAGSIVGGEIQRAGVSNAAEAQLIASREALAAQKEQAATAQDFLQKQSDLAREELKPFQQSQLRALQGLEGLSQFGNPLEQANRAQSTEAIQRQLSAQGLLRSTTQGDQLSNLEVGLAGNRANILQQLAGTGAVQEGSSILQNLGTGGANIQSNLGNQLSAGLLNQGNINAANFQNQANIGAGQSSGVGNALQELFGGIGTSIQNNAAQASSDKRFQQLLDMLAARG